VGFRWVYPKEHGGFFGYVPGCLNPAYVIPTSSHDYHLYSFYPRTVCEWNFLPSELLGTPEAFRSALTSV